MTDQELNSIIAAHVPRTHVGLKKRGLWYRPKANGYTNCEAEAGRYTMEEAKDHEYLYGAPDGHVRICEFSQPNYAGDLNAMADAEKTLTPDQEENYVERLSAALMSEAYEDATADRWKKSNLSSGDSTYRATARQRAEAFVRTVGKMPEP